MKAYLILADGHVFTGESFGAIKETICEWVFNTSMTGYTEILTDPSYAGQGVVMTYPLIGNYGVSYEDEECGLPYVEGFVVHELSRLSSHFNMNMSLNDYMIENDIPGIQGVDTRAITRIIREKGYINGMITTRDYDIADVLERIINYHPRDLVKRCTCHAPYKLGKGSLRVALYDYGMKRSIANELVKRDCEVTILPAETPAQTIINGHFDGVMLSNGPGDPADNEDIIMELKILKASGIPIFAICLGHQMMAIAHDMTTSPMHFGHHGANHPVRDLTTNRIYISTQNHNYMIDASSINRTEASIWFENVNDGTVEGLKYLHEPIMTVQFHPEAHAGPLDTSFLFDEFRHMMEEYKDAKKT